MSLQAQDMPDDYQWLTGSARFPLADLGELAVRLGSIDTFDRRGEVLWASDIRYGLADWQTKTGGAGSSVALTATGTYNSPYALRLTAGAVAGAWADAYHMFVVSESTRQGLEVGVLFFAPFNVLTMEMDRALDGTMSNAMVTIDNNLLQLIVHATVGDVAFATLPLTLDATDGLPHNMKLVVDWTLGSFVRFIFDQHEYNLSMFQMPTTPLMPYEYNLSNVIVWSDGFNVCEANLRYEIITSNEP
jgi:ketosteroid isomerase-like protein